MLKLLVVGLVLAGGAFGLSLAEKKEVERAMKSAERELEYFKKKCGSEVKLDIDWKSFEGKYEGSHKIGSAVGYCKSIVAAAANVCESGADGKTAIQNKVKTVRCGYQAGVTTKDFPTTGLKIEGTGVTAVYDWNTGNLQDGAKKFLMSNL